MTERRGQLSVTFRYDSSYLEISDARPISPELPLSERSTTTMGRPGAMAAVGSRVSQDLAELWRRIAFSIVMNNTDDHLRNHGFLFEDGGWAIAPAFDLNPNPRLGERSTSISYETAHRTTCDALFEAAPFFGVTSARSDEIWHEVVAATAGWQGVARDNGISQKEITYFADAMDAQREG